MFSTRFIAAAAASLSLMSSVTADYNPASQANVAMYYGQGPNQQRLAHFCDSSAVDIIPIGFINIFPNFANGLVAENFGNQCWDGNYTGPGYNGVNNPKNNFLYMQCPQLQEDIYYCQTQTKKKILLSLGGDGGNYQLNGAADGQYLADFLWGAYGPYNASWVAKGGVRPLDRGASNTDLTKTIDIDGFDFDIERTSPDNQAGYIACIKRLREHFAAYKAAKPCSKTYLISGAPQCPLPEGNMGLTIAGAKFDLLFIQFYNNGANGCTARNWITNKNAGGFNYNSWVTIVNQGASAGAKLYLGLLGSSSAGTSGDYLTAIEAQSLIDAWHSAPQFGGVMLWEATYAENNLPSSFPGKNYYQIMKQVLNKYAPATTAPATVCSTTVSSTRSSTSSTKTSSSTKISTTSSTAKSSSTSKSASSTKSSTSSKITSTSSSKVSSSSSVKTSSSSTKISSSSSVKPSSSSTKLSSSSSVKTTSSSLVVSSSSSKAATTSSSSILTSKTAAGEFTTTSSSTSSAAPTATGCVYKGCFTEATGMRALSSDVLADFEGMTIEKCAEFCSGYTLYGLEYTGECYCGNSLNTGSVSAPEDECNLPCTGDASQTCGGSNRLNVYECGTLPTSSSTSSSATSSIVSISISESSTSSATLTSESSSSTSSEATVSSSSSETYVTPSISMTFSYSATVTSSSSSEYVTPSISETFSYSATETSSSSSEYVTPSISNTFSYSATETSSSSSSYVTPSISNTFSYSATESSSSTSSEYVTPTPSSSSSSETSSSEIVTPTPSSSSETETTTSSSSSETTSSTESGPVTSSTYVSSSSSFPTGPHYTNSSPSVGSTKSGYPTVITSTSVPTYTPSSSKSSGGEVTYTSKPTSSSVTKYTTSTVCTTRTETITSCAPTVTNCPVGSVTTKTIPLYTTVCPVTETEVKSTKTPIGKPTTTPVPTTYKPTGPVTKYTTSTVYTTSVYTITSCAPSVTDCPSKLGHVTTEIIKLYTTVCPVTEKTPVATPSTYAPVETPVETPAYTGVAVPSKSYPAGGELDSSTTTLSSTTTQYKTIKIVKSTATIVPMPPTTLAPYPTGPASEGYPSGTAAPTAVAQVTSSAEGVTGTKTPVPIYATGAASNSRSAVGAMVAVAAGVIALML